MPDDDDPMYKAYRSSVWENDAMDRVPIHVGRNILIVPEYGHCRDSRGHLTLYMDSRFAFGDGRHPTTMLCLTLLEEFLVELAPAEKKRITMLDIGTGTGILAILASRMGLDNILALDIDPDSITNAAELARLNEAPSIEFRLMDAALLPPVPAYGLITANLLPPILRTVIPLSARLSLPGAPVIVSGIGDASIDEMEELMINSGFTEMKHVSSGWWHAYLLRH
ncbi:MAG TPA: 50S ribosomal protein L11 methyltransferase [Spirochaetota bacterium]|nr:50S ribosomal protein L11 methyltransferase [Spirochaetota bacterium]